MRVFPLISSRVGSCSAIAIAPSTQSDCRRFQGAEGLLALPHVNVAVEGAQLEIRSAAVDRSRDRPIDVDADSSAVALGLARVRAGGELHIEIRKDIPLI